jgi:hypothetical protein
VRRPGALAALAGLAVALAAADARALELKLLGQPLRIDITESFTAAYHGDFGYMIIERDNTLPPTGPAPQLENHFYDVTNRLNVDIAWKRWRLATRFDTGVYFGTSDTVEFGRDPVTMAPTTKPANWCGSPTSMMVTAIEQSRFCNVPQSGWPGETFFWPEKVALEYTGRSVEATIGDFYISVGRGMVLSLRKLDELGIDTTLQGARFVLHEGKLGATLAVGVTNIQNIDEATGRFAPDPFDLIAAGRVEYRFLDKIIVGLHEVGGVLNQDAVNNVPHREHDAMLMYGGSVDIPRLTRWLSLYLEGAGQMEQTSDKRQTGYALYGAATGYFGVLSVLVEAKHYVNFQRWKPSISGTLPEFVAVNYINPPTAERIDTELLATVYDVSGPRLRLDYRVGPRLLVYASYAYFEDRGVDVFQDKMRMYHDPYGGVELRWEEGRSHLFTSGGYRVEQCAADNTPCLGQSPPGGEFQHIGHVEWDFAQALPRRFSIESQGRALFRHGDVVSLSDANGNTVWPNFYEGEAYVALKWTPRLVFSSGLEWSTRPSSKVNQYFVNGAVQWNVTTASSIRFWAGGTRGGLKCISGVCRDFPPFTGAKLEVVVRL